MMKKLLSLLALIFIVAFVYAQEPVKIFESAGNDNRWSNSENWDPSPPTINDLVVITAGDTAIVDDPTAVAKGISVGFTDFFSPLSGNLVIQDGGVLNLGTGGSGQILQFPVDIPSMVIIDANSAVTVEQGGEIRANVVVL